MSLFGRCKKIGSSIFYSGGQLQLSSSVPVHWTNSEGPDSKYRNNEGSSNYSQTELQSSGTTSSAEGNMIIGTETIWKLRFIAHVKTRCTLRRLSVL